MKIISLHWGFTPGGIATYASHLEKLSYLFSVKIKTVCIASSRWTLDEIILSQLDVEYVLINGRLDFTWIKKVRELLVKESPDLILVHGFNGAFVSLISSFGLKIPVISTWHGEYYPSTVLQNLCCPFINILQILLYKFYVSKIATVSLFSKNKLIELGVCEKKINVIYNGIPDIETSEACRVVIRESLNLRNDAIVIGAACRFVSPKGLFFLLESFELVAKYFDNVFLVLWGDGPLRKDLGIFARNQGLSDFVLFPGYASNISSCLSALDIFVMSSSSENFSISLLEAMRAGLPIIATNVGGNPEAIEDGVHGFLVPYGDTQVMANCIMNLVNDSQLRSQLGVNARLRFKKEFTDIHMVNNTANWIFKYQSIYR